GSPPRAPVLRPVLSVNTAAHDAVFDPGEAAAAGTDDDQRSFPRAGHGSHHAWPHHAAVGARRSHRHQGWHPGSPQQGARRDQSRYRAPAARRETVGRGATRIRGKVRCQTRCKSARPSGRGRFVRAREAPPRPPFCNASAHDGGVTMRYLEDFEPGQKFGSGRLSVEAARIKSLATEFDPQPFHLDEDSARDSFFKELAASGWHTAAMTMRLLVDREVKPAAGVIGIGFAEMP